MKKSIASDTIQIAKKIKRVGRLPPYTVITVYGRGGTGKTTWAATFPAPILFLDIKERGTDSIRDIKGVDVLLVDHWDEIEKVYWYLKNKDNKYKTIVWDSVSQAQDLAIAKIMAAKGKTISPGNIGDWGSMRRQDYAEVAGVLKNWLLYYKELAVERDQNLIFIAHDRVFNLGEDDNTEELLPEVGPRVMPSIVSTLNGISSMVVNTFIRQKEVVKKTGKKKKKVLTIQYCMRVGPHDLYLTKVRKPKSVILPKALVNPSYETLIAATVGAGNAEEE